MYRKSYSLTSPSVPDQYESISPDSNLLSANIDAVTLIDGTLNLGYDGQMSLHAYNAPDEYINTWTTTVQRRIFMRVSSQYINKPVFVSATYTKTTDTAPAIQTLLTSEVNSLASSPSVSYASASASSANNELHAITESPGSSGNS